MGSSNRSEDRDGWARLRFAVVGPLLASPPPRGRLRAELERLAEQSWEHPTSGGRVRFSVSTIERWYYQARAAHQDPVKALRRRARTDVGRTRTMSAALIAALRDQHLAHPVMVGAAPPRQFAGARRGRPVSRAAAVLRHPDPGDALAGAGAPAPPQVVRGRRQARRARRARC